MAANNDAAFAMKQSIVSGLTKAVQESLRGTSRQLEFIGKALAANAIPAADRRRVHQAVGEAAQRSTVQAYTHRRGRRAGLPSYRVSAKDERNRRYAGGALLRAIQRADFFEATATGIRFINSGALNKEARQWRRLNFGAGSAAGTSPAQFQVTWAGLVVGALGLAPDPRPAFRVPRGYWSNPGTGRRVGPGKSAAGSSIFTPVGEGGPGGRPSVAVMSRGIVAANFLDAGIKRIATEFPKQYQGLYRELYANAKTRTQIQKRINVVAPQPRVQNVTVRKIR